MNGIETTKEITKICLLNKVNRPPIIGISASISEEDRVNFFKAGINSF